jgi:hypothetical protein
MTETFHANHGGDTPAPKPAPLPVQPMNDVPPPPQNPHVIPRVGKLNDVPPPPSSH